MTIFSTLYSFCPPRRIRVIALLLVATFMAFVAYDRLIAAPERRHVIRRYEEFRAVVATGDANRIMQFVAPEFRDWAIDRLHLYKTFVSPLDNRSTIWVSSGKATIRPKPRVHFYVIPGGDGVTMVRQNGEWFMGGVNID